MAATAHAEVGSHGRSATIGTYAVLVAASLLALAPFFFLFVTALTHTYTEQVKISELAHPTGAELPRHLHADEVRPLAAEQLHRRARHDVPGARRRLARGLRVREAPVRGPRRHLLHAARDADDPDPGHDPPDLPARDAPRPDRLVHGARPARRRGPDRGVHDAAVHQDDPERARGGGPHRRAGRRRDHLEDHPPAQPARRSPCSASTPSSSSGAACSGRCSSRRATTRARSRPGSRPCSASTSRTTG